MSYTNVIANTRTQSHSIVPETKETTALERIQNAQGTGITGSAIRKVAQFIGMDAPEEPITAPAALGLLSVDFELEQQQRRSTYKGTAALEETERSGRQLDTKVEDARRAHAFVVSKSVLQKLQAPRQWTSRDYPVSRKFLNYMRRTLTAIEEIERQRRKEDVLGENSKRVIARQTSIAIVTGIQNPTLRKVELPTRGAGLYDALGSASGVAMKKLLPVAESFAASAYQIGNFAARAAYFFGGKAAVKAQDVGQKAAVQGQVLGGQALEQGQILGQKAAEGAQVLGQKAVIEAQHLGNQAISGVHSIGQSAQTLGTQAQQVALNTAAGAQNLALQTIEKTKDLTHQAHVAAGNAIVSVQNIGEQVVEKVKDIKDDIQQSMTSTSGWEQSALLEEAERESRSKAQFGSNRFALAMRTSALVKAEIIARNPNYSATSEPNYHYGTAILEETERLRRIVSDKTSPVARINAKRSAAIISLYRQQTLGRTQQGRSVANIIVPATAVLIKEAQINAAPIRYQAAM